MGGLAPGRLKSRRGLSFLSEAPFSSYAETNSALPRTLPKLLQYLPTGLSEDLAREVHPSWHRPSRHPLMAPRLPPVRPNGLLFRRHRQSEGRNCRSSVRKAVGRRI